MHFASDGRPPKDFNRQGWTEHHEQGYTAGSTAFQTLYGVVLQPDPAKHRTQNLNGLFGQQTPSKKLSSWSAGPRTGIHSLSARGAQELLLRGPGQGNNDWHSVGVMFQHDFPPPDHPDFASDPYGALIVQAGLGFDEDSPPGAGSPGSYHMFNRHGHDNRYSATLQTTVNGGNQVQGNKGVNLRLEEKAGINAMEAARRAYQKAQNLSRTVEGASALAAGFAHGNTYEAVASDLDEAAAAAERSAALMETGLDRGLEGLELAASAETLAGGDDVLVDDLGLMGSSVASSSSSSSLGLGLGLEGA